jgi:hypothetical protein
MPKAKGAREKGTKRGTTWVAGEPASLAEQASTSTFAKMMGMVRVSHHRDSGGCVLRKNEVGPQRDKFLRESLPRLRVGRRPAKVDPDVAVFRPPERFGQCSKFKISLCRFINPSCYVSHSIDLVAKPMQRSPSVSPGSQALLIQKL